MLKCYKKGKVMEKKDIGSILANANSTGITKQRTFEGADKAKRGKPRKSEDEKASQRVCLYLTKQEYENLKAIAKKDFLGMSEIALAKQVLLKFIKNGKI